MKKNKKLLDLDTLEPNLATVLVLCQSVLMRETLKPLFTFISPIPPLNFVLRNSKICHTTLFSALLRENRRFFS